MLLLGCAGCGNQTKPSANSLQKSKCLDEVNAIPEINALRKARKKGQEETSPRPFEGLEIALTINDMITSQINAEANPDDLCYMQDTRENFDKLVNALKANQMPPTVNFLSGDGADAQLQTAWLASGNLLGNNTFDRHKAKKNTTKEFIDNIARNDQLFATFWKNAPPKRKYFRYPRLKANDDGFDREAVKAYLKQSGYMVAPYTIDAQDELFSQIYCGAQTKSAADCINLVKANFFSLLLDTTLKARAIAKEKAGREIKHILIIHTNQLTCDALAEMLVWFKGLGARFISLDEALSDPFYAEGNAHGVVGETKSAQFAAAEKK